MLNISICSQTTYVFSAKISGHSVQHSVGLNGSIIKHFLNCCYVYTLIVLGLGYKKTVVWLNRQKRKSPQTQCVYLLKKK